MFCSSKLKDCEDTITSCDQLPLPKHHRHGAATKSFHQMAMVKVGWSPRFTFPVVLSLLLSTLPLPWPLRKPWCKWISEAGLTWRLEAGCTERSEGAGSSVSESCHLFAAFFLGRLDWVSSGQSTGPWVLHWSHHHLFSLVGYQGSRAHALFISIFAL